MMPQQFESGSNSSLHPPLPQHVQQHHDATTPEDDKNNTGTTCGHIDGKTALAAVHQNEDALHSPGGRGRQHLALIYSPPLRTLKKEAHDPPATSEAADPPGMPISFDEYYASSSEEETNDSLLLQQTPSSSPYQDHIKRVNAMAKLVNKYQHHVRSLSGTASDEEDQYIMSDHPLTPLSLDSEHSDESSDFGSIGGGGQHHMKLAKRTSEVLGEFEDYIANMDKEEEQQAVNDTNHATLQNDPPEECIEYIPTSIHQRKDPPEEGTKGGHTSSSSLLHPRNSYLDELEGITSKNRRLSMEFDSLKKSLDASVSKSNGHGQRSFDIGGFVGSLRMFANRTGHDGTSSTANEHLSKKDTIRRRLSQNAEHELWENETNLFTTSYGTSKRGMARRSVSKEATERELWSDEINFFQMSSAATVDKNNIHDCRYYDGDYIKENRHHRYMTAALCSRSCRKIACSVLVNCVILLTLMLITFGVSMEKKNPTISAIFKHEGAVHKLNWFTRPMWSGQTYAEALNFCASNNQILCSYNDICPYGPGGKASEIGEGFTEDPNGLAWVATSDASNSWVHVGSKDHCLTYDFMHEGKMPNWGLTGEDNEEITRHVVCCPPDNKRNASKGHNHTIVQTYDFLDPKWYNIPDDWAHSSTPTFNDAKDFCKNIEPSRFLCPYEEYCPHGPGFPPLSGGPKETDIQQQQDIKQFAIILDEIGFGIVQVSGGSSDSEEESVNLCKVRYIHRTGDHSSIEEKIQERISHIMCCKLSNQ